jgi:protein-disulfide isomerase
MSKREELRARRKRQAQFQSIFLIALGGLAIATVGYLIYQGMQSGGVATTAAAYDAGKAVGPADAKVVVQEFADFQCPFCAQFVTGDAQKTLIDQYAKTGLIRFEYHHYIVVDGNVGGFESRHAAVASECAKEQGKFWEYHDYVFAHQNGEGQGAFSDANLKTFAADLGLDTAKFNACLDAQTYAYVVQQDEALGRSLGINQTPTIFVNGKLVNALKFGDVKAAIDAALAK